MALLLVELAPADPSREAVEALLDRLTHAAASAGGTLVEAQVTVDGRRVFAIVEHGSADDVRHLLADASIDAESVDPVRLVGADLDEIKARRAGGEYLVEWDLPSGLTMDAYLTRKKEKAPLYDEVPEATFLRTYVREDLVKCLCFYDGDDEGAIVKARSAVSAPIDRFHRLAR